MAVDDVDVEGWLRINKEEQLPGRITVGSTGFSFDPRDGSGGWCVVPGELTKNPLSSKASAQTVSLQVVTSSARGTFVLDFTLAGKDAIETRDRVKDALVRFLAPPMRAGPSLLPGKGGGSGNGGGAEIERSTNGDDVGLGAIDAGQRKLTVGALSAKAWSNMTTDIPASDITTGLYKYMHIYKYIYNMCTSDNNTHTVNEVVRSNVVGGGGMLPEDELLDLIALLALLYFTCFA
jgi:hypothetical protein